MRVQYNGKVWDEETVVKYMTSKKTSLQRAILIVYDRQTQDEKAVKQTKHHNGVGFSGADGSYLSYLATWIKAGKDLSGKHYEKAKARMPKYRRQVLEHIASLPGAQIIDRKAA